jgi:osmotically-inducible protein OsmY
MWNKDEITGKKKQITGTINEKVGEFIHDPQLEAEGEAEQLEGQAQQKIGKLRRKAGEAIGQAGKVIAGSGITSLLALSLLGGSVALNGCGTASTHEATVKPTPLASMTNAELEQKIKAKFKTDAQLDAADISVDANADRNQATLAGTVGSESLRTKAIELAKSAHSGLIVTTKIDVKPGKISRTAYSIERAREERGIAKSRGEKLGDSLNDAWIHTTIVAQLSGNTTTPEHKINVDVNDNVVTLRGTVGTLEQKTEAESLAKNTESVKSVTNQLKISSAPMKKS